MNWDKMNLSPRDELPLSILKSLIVVLIATLVLAGALVVIGTPQVNSNLPVGQKIVVDLGVDGRGNIIPNTGAVSDKPSIPKYGVFELTLTASQDYSNPYLKMPNDLNTPGFVVGIFSGPNGEKLQVDGFWDGGKTWKIRIAPTSVGDWSYTTTSSDLGLNQKSGSFSCVSSNSKGFLRVDPIHSHHFMWDNGAPFYWGSVTTMVSHFDDRDAQGGHSRVDDNSFQALVSTRSEQGFNIVHWGFYGFNKPQFTDKTQQNEGGAPFTNFDADQLNPAYYQYGDKRVEALQAKGIATEFTLGWPDQNIAEEVGHSRIKRYLRYLIARYSAYNIVYNLFGEVQEFGPEYINLTKDYAQLIRKWDPYKHLVTTHTAGDVDPELINLAALDFITIQRPTDATDDYLKYKKPVLNAEYFGYEDDQVNGEQLRPLIWDVRMRGGYFVYESWGSQLKSSGALYAQNANNFFRTGTRFWELEYHPELFNNQPGLANPGHEYVSYTGSGGTTTVNLSNQSGSFSVSWYNPRTGATSAAGSVTAGKTRSFNAPDSKDWVLHLTNCAVMQSSSQAATELSPDEASEPVILDFINAAFRMFLPVTVNFDKSKTPTSTCP